MTNDFFNNICLGKNKNSKLLDEKVDFYLNTDCEPGFMKTDISEAWHS